MKVCLINPPINMHSRAWFPIGIGYVAAYLLKNCFKKGPVRALKKLHSLYSYKPPFMELQKYSNEWF